MPREKASGVEIFHADVNPSPVDGGVDLVQVVADLDDRDPTELESLYDRVDDLLTELFSDPPSPEAQVEMSFTYEGYRIDIDQTGHVRLIPIE